MARLPFSGAVDRGALLACGAVIGIALMTLAGCAVGPNFKAPQPDMPATWAGPTPPAPTPRQQAQAQQLAQWWTQFNDPTLTSLIDRAVQSNLDLQLAAARVRQARAVRGVAISAIGPTLDAIGSFLRTRTSVTSPVAGATGAVTNSWRTGLDAAWELDIFGGTRRNIEAATADVQSAIENERNVLVTLSGEVALNYIDLRAFQRRVIIAQKNLETQQHNAEITRQRFEAGLVSGLDVANARAQAATTASVIPTLEASAQQTIYSLSVLLGSDPGALLKELGPPEEIPSAPAEVPVGVPSDLLRRRPDIRSAESGIHAATARIGVAEADLFPKFSITGSAGYQSSKANSLFNWNNRFYSFGPSVDWNLFATGATLSNIQLQKALTDEAFITYQQTVLNALQEVENALIASSKEEERRTALVEAVAQNRKALDIATRLYREGQTDFLSVIQAQGALFVTEDQLAQSTQNVSTDLVSLYKALGGGWQGEESSGK